MSIRTREIIGKAILETLEHRQMLSTVTLADGALVVQGNPTSPNTIGIHSVDGKVWAVTDSGTSQKIATSSVHQIRIIGGDEADNVSVDASVKIPVRIQTGNGNDTIVAANGRDTIVSGNGDDNVLATGGNNYIDTGNGDDIVNGGAGHDTLRGGNGNDVLNTGAGHNEVVAASGNDTVYSGAGRDRIWLGTGNNSANVKLQDIVHGARGDDVHRRHPQLAGNGNVGSELPPPVGDSSGSDNSNPAHSQTDNGGSTSDNGDTTTPASIASASSFTLINAVTGQAIPGYENITGTVSIDLSSLPTTKLNIVANYDSAIGSVVFGYDGNSTYSYESVAPYAFAHDTGSFTPTVGNHTISATAYSGVAGQGSAGATVTLNLVVSQSAVNPTPDPTPDPTPTPTPTPTPDPIPTPNPTPGRTSPVGVITVMENSVAADHAIHVNAISSNTVAGTLLTAKFIWDFGDPGSNYNQLVGWNAAHLYTQPGKYTIKLTITNEDGKTSVTSTTVNITAANRKVIYVSNDGSDSNSGLSPQNALKSFSKAMSMVGDNTEVLFHSGDKFDVPKGASISNTNVVIGSYGSGTKPILSYSGPKNYSAIITTTGKAQDVTIENVTFDSIFTNNYEKTGMPDAIAAGGKNITAYGCTILNIGYGINTNQKPTGLLMQQCDAPDVHGIRSYMIYCQGSDFVIVGNTVANSTREHCMRVDGTDRILIEDNDLTNQDRRPMGDSLDTDKQTITVHHGSYAFVYGNTTHGGRVEIGPLGEADGLKPTNIIHRLNYVVIEANDFTFLPNDRVEIDHGTSHVMICDNQISVTSGAGIAVQAMGMYTSFPGYGTRHVEDVIVAGDNSITGASQKVSVGKGSVGVKILPSGSPVYSMGYKAAA